MFTHNHNITCIAKGGCYLSGSKFNCLMHSVHRKPPKLVAQQLHTLALSLLATYNIRYVFLDQIINRDPAKFPHFAPSAQEANAHLQYLISHNNTTSIRFWLHRNLTNPQKKALAADGVHFNQVGIKKYWRSIRGAIILAGQN